VSYDVRASLPESQSGWLDIGLYYYGVATILRVERILLRTLL
jgi:hypothetical protein